MRRLIVLVLFVLALTPVSATGTWQHASSAHFEIFTTAGAGRARDTLQAFERIHAFFAPHLGLTPPDGRPVRLILFSNEREFRPYRINDAVVAYYRAAPDRDYIVMQSYGPAAHAVMVHEYVHLLLARSGGRYPVWLNEGLAEYFATIPAAGSSVSVGQAPRGRLRDLSARRLLSLERLFSVTHQSPEYRTADGGGRFYAQSWALTHMLVSDDRYRDGWGTFLMQVRTGTPPARALDAVYGRTTAQVQADLERYVDTRRFATQTVRFAEQARGAPVGTREVAPLEAGIVLATLLGGAREDAPRARTVFEELARQHGEDLSLVEARATFEWRMAGAQAAAPWLDRALALGSTSARLHRDYALVVADADRERAEVLLEQAIDLDPADVRARIQLAALVAPGRPADVLLVLDPVTRAGPVDAFDVLRLRADAHLALGDIERAHTLARELTAVATTRQRRALAARVLAQVEAHLGAGVLEPLGTTR